MRARNIKPGLAKNEDLASCSIPARYLFAMLPMIADREGRLEDRPLRIKAELFPYDSFKIEPLLSELAAVKDCDGSSAFIIRYKVDKKKYIQIKNFLKHQTPHVKEGASSIQAPCLSDTNPIQALPFPERAPPDSLIPDSLIPDSLIPDSLIPDSLIPDSLIPLHVAPTPNGDREPPPPVLTIPLSRKGEEQTITQADIDEWQELFPAVEVVSCVKRIDHYFRNEKPEKRKSSRKGLFRSIAVWLAKEQERGGGTFKRAPPNGQVVENRRLTWGERKELEEQNART